LCLEVQPCHGITSACQKEVTLGNLKHCDTSEVKQRFRYTASTKQWKSGYVQQSRSLAEGSEDSSEVGSDRYGKVEEAYWTTLSVPHAVFNNDSDKYTGTVETAQAARRLGRAELAETQGAQSPWGIARNQFAETQKAHNLWVAHREEGEEGIERHKRQAMATTHYCLESQTSPTGHHCDRLALAVCDTSESGQKWSVSKAIYAADTFLFRVF
jgi:hypothetical protein